MVSSPGFLSDLNEDGLAAWGRHLSKTITDATRDGRNQWGRNPAILNDGDPSLGALSTIEWPPDPIAILGILADKPSQDVAAFLDWTDSRGQIGRCVGHEEYLEWRVVRDATGAIARIEMTCETPDYMARVAGYAPETLLKIAAEFAGEAEADARDIYGDDYRQMTAEQRVSAFNRRHISRGSIPVSNYGNGNKALLCMTQSVNSLAAAVNLAVRAAYPWSTGARPLTGPEAIVGEGWAAPCRNSDPNIATVVIRAVHAGSKIALADPPGIYMLPFRTDQVTLDDEPLPNSWLNYSRGAAAADNPLGRNLYQRLVISPPKASGRSIADLMDTNGEPVTTGLQVARNQAVAILYKATPSANVNRIVVAAPPAPDPCGAGHASASYYRGLFDEFLESQQSATEFARRVDVMARFDV